MLTATKACQLNDIFPFTQAMDHRIVRLVPEINGALGAFPVQNAEVHGRVLSSTMFAL